MSTVHEEIRIRWTGTARFDQKQAEWALRVGSRFAVDYVLDREGRTGLRRAAVWALCSPLYESQAAYVYYTKGGAVVVRIHGQP